MPRPPVRSLRSAFGRALPRPRVASPAVAGDLRLHELRSAAFGNRRLLRVLLPPGYDDPAQRSRRYPVLYLNDGQNLFDPATAALAAGEWRVDETVVELVRSGEIPPLIVVGIDHAGRRRIGEYVPWEDPQLGLTGRAARGARYPGFLLDEVAPYVNATFRTKRGAENTGLGGSSLGAAIALFTVLARPGAVGRLLLESPSLFIAGGRLLEESGRNRRWPRRVYMGIGTRETGSPERDGSTVRRARQLEQFLRHGGLGEDRLRVVVDGGAAHTEAAWAARLPAALRFLYGR